MKRAMFISAACVLAFLAGRNIPRGTPASASRAAPEQGVDGARAGGGEAVASAASLAPSPGRVGTSPGAGATRPAGPATTASRDPSPSVEVGSASSTVSRLPAEWIDVVREDPTRANNVKNLVIEAMQVRVDPSAIRACLRADGVSGGLVLRFEVDVDSNAAELRLGDARFVEAIEGPAVSDEAGLCIAQLLTGNDLHAGDDLLAGYVGPVDYQLTINVPAAK